MWSVDIYPESLSIKNDDIKNKARPRLQCEIMGNMVMVTAEDLIKKLIRT